MVEQINTSISSEQESKKWFGIMSWLKSLFHKDKNNWEKKSQTTKFFNLTRKDAIVSVIVCFVIVACAILYWKKVYDNYNDINSNTEPLKSLSTYNLNVDDKRFFAYSEEWDKITNINSLMSVYDNIRSEIDGYELFEANQKNYYEVLLQNLYLPSINVWKDPYTRNFDLTVLWQKYLDVDQFQDHYLIQTWSDFIKYVWNDADYNEIETINIWDKVVLPDNPNYFYTPISVSFSSPNKRSFLLLVNKLSVTSNQNNISLLNEFFYYLLNTIKSEKKSEINKLMQEYRPEFSSSIDSQWPDSMSALTEDQEDKYRDMVIWYNLYHWIKGDWKMKDSTLLVDDSIIEKTIRQTASCNKVEESKQDCFYDFRDKYRSIPYLAYNIGLENQANRTLWLLNFLRDLPPAISITNFQFERYSNSSFLNNEEENYKWSVVFNAYWRNITTAELEEAAWLLWILCFWDTDEKISITADVALNRLNAYMVSLWWSREFSNVSSLWELKQLLEEIKSEYDGLSNYDKMVKLFEMWRMLNDANLCEQ